MVCFTFGLLVINSLFPVSIFFYRTIIRLCVLAEVAFNLRDFLSLLAFIVYIRGITAVIGYFVTFFPKKLEGRFFKGCPYRWAYIIVVTVLSYTQILKSYYGLSLDIFHDSAIGSISFYGSSVQVLAPLLLVVIVAVIFISKPEEMSLRRWTVEF